MKNINQFSIAFMFLSLASHVQADQIRNGKWEVTSKTEMSGMPAGMPNQQHKVIICVDNKSAGKPPIGAEPSCKVADYKVVNKSASWKMECSGQMKMSGTGSITFSDDKYSGSSTMTMEIPGSKPMTIKNGYTGKRIGDC